MKHAFAVIGLLLLFVGFNECPRGLEGVGLMVCAAVFMTGALVAFAVDRAAARADKHADAIIAALKSVEKSETEPTKSQQPAATSPRLE